MKFCTHFFSTLLPWKEKNAQKNRNIFVSFYLICYFCGIILKAKNYDSNSRNRCSKANRQTHR